MLFNKITRSVDKEKTDEYIAGEQHLVRIDNILDEYTEVIYENDKVGWFLRNVMDHCPVYAVFRADLDTD